MRFSLLAVVRVLMLNAFIAARDTYFPFINLRPLAWN